MFHKTFILRLKLCIVLADIHEHLILKYNEFKQELCIYFSTIYPDIGVNYIMQRRISYKYILIVEIALICKRTIISVI